jgi:putative transcriptional regulator
VAPGQGFFLHSRDVMLETSVAVDDEIAVTGDPEMLDALAEKRGPRRLLFALGYAGWGPGQLESERARGVWFDIPADPDLVFAPDPAKTWARAVARREIPL